MAIKYPKSPVADRLWRDATLRNLRTDIGRLWRSRAQRGDPNAFGNVFTNPYGEREADYCLSPGGAPTSAVWRVTLSGYTGAAACLAMNGAHDLAYSATGVDPDSGTQWWTYVWTSGGNSLTLRVAAKNYTFEPGTALYIDVFSGISYQDLWWIPPTCSGWTRYAQDPGWPCGSGSVVSVVRL